MKNRCDEVKDCGDASDERNCSLFKVDNDLYRKEYPSIIKKKKVTPIYVNLSIHNIDKLEEMTMIFSAKVHVQLKWFDSR
jgi:hypothetical protein